MATSSGANGVERKAMPSSAQCRATSACMAGVNWYASTISRRLPKCFFLSA